MRTNVFLRSMRRQPFKAAVMLLVIGVMTFAFVSRAAEYLMISGETERLSGYYTSVGTLEPTSGGKLADRGEAAAVVARHPDVEVVNRYRNVSAVLQEDFQNADVDVDKTLTGGTTGYFAFYGTLAAKSSNYFEFDADTYLTGYSDIAPTRRFENFVVEVGRKIILGRGDIDYGKEAYEAIEEGGRFFAVGFYDTTDLNFCAVDTDDEGRFERMTLKLVPVTNDAFFYPLAEGEEADFDDPALAHWKDVLPFVRDQQHAVNALAVEDMSALPDVQEDSRRIYLTDGRWLDSTDTAEGRRVCVIHNGFASLRGLKVGDTLTMKLQDVPSYFGYCLAPAMEEAMDLWREAKTAEAETFEIVGIYEYTDGSQYKYAILRDNLYIPSSVVPEDFACANGSGLDEELYHNLSHLAHTAKNQFYDTTEGPYPGEAAFVLKDPEAQAGFLADTREELEALGFQAVMVDNGWDSFQAAAVPMRRSSLYNAVIFTAVLVAAMVLVAFAYFFMRRRELAVVRAMGVPAGRCAAEISLPLLIVGVLGLVPGALLGWRYAERNAGEALESLTAFGGDSAAQLPGTCLAALCGIVVVLLTAVVLTFAHVRARMPVLEQIQGGAPAGARKTAPKTVPASVPAAAAAAAVEPAAVRASVVRPAAPAAGKGGAGAKVMLRFVWRHMTRAWAKSLLTALLAAAFTVGLAAISLSIENNTQKMEDLYENISVNIELVQKDSTDVTVYGGGFLFEKTVQAVLDTGYITDAYLEGSRYGSINLLFGEDTDRYGERYPVRAYPAFFCTFFGIDDLEEFFANRGGGQTITYNDGWDESLFSKDWSGGGTSGQDGDGMIPILLAKEYYDRYMEEYGTSLQINCLGKLRRCQIVGYYDAADATDKSGRPMVLMPLPALQDLMGQRMCYSTAVFTVDPARNHDLDALRESIDALANSPHIGGVPVRVLLHDEELRQAAEPLEESIALMKLLYPVMLVLSVLVAAAGAALFVMLSAKEAAILRIQGTGKVRVQIMLSLQQVFTSFAGLLVGLLGMAVYLAGRQPELTGTIVGGALLCALLYLAAATVGAVGASMAVTGKNPLEMLQVKE